MRDYTSFSMPARCRPITENIYLYDAYAKDLSGFIGAYRRVWHRLEKTTSRFTCADTVNWLSTAASLISATQAVDPVYPDDEELLRGKCFVAIGSWRRNGANADAVWKLVRTRTPASVCLRKESGDLKIPLEKGVLLQKRVHFIGSDRRPSRDIRMSRTRPAALNPSAWDSLMCGRHSSIYEKALEKELDKNLISRKNGWNRKGCITYRASMRQTIQPFSYCYMCINFQHFSESIDWQIFSLHILLYLFITDTSHTASSLPHGCNLPCFSKSVAASQMHSAMIFHVFFF